MHWFITISGSFVLGMFFMFLAYRYENKAIKAFVAESLDKTKEINYFWRQYRSATSPRERQMVIDSQWEYWKERKKKIIFTTIGISLITIAIILFSLTVWAF